MLYQEICLPQGLGARLDCYLLDPELAPGCHKTRPMAVVLPGGAYLIHAHREAEPVAARLLGMGFDVCILRYSTYVTGMDAQGMPVVSPRSHYPLQVVQAMSAVACVRDHAQEWGIDPQRVCVMGFSAGAHIAGSLAERFDDAELLELVDATAGEVKPDALALCYPMVTGSLVADAQRGVGNQFMRENASLLAEALFGRDDPCQSDYDAVDLRRGVRSDMPRTFVWQTGEDDMVDPTETLDLVAEMRRQGVPCELHLFERGPHGLSLADDTCAVDDTDINPEAAAWVDLFARWFALPGRA